MRIEAREIISKPTEVSARTLVSFSGVIVVTMLYHLGAADWVFFNQAIPPQVFDKIAILVLIFLLAGHLIHWWGDHSAYSSWFQRSEVLINLIGVIGSVENTEPPLDALQRKLKILYDAVDKVAIEKGGVGPDIRSSFGEFSARQDLIHSHQRDILDLLRQIDAKFYVVSGSAWIQVYIWYLAVPLIMEADLAAGRPSFITRVLGVDSGGFQVWQARRARSAQIAQAPGARLRGSCCPARNAA